MTIILFLVDTSASMNQRTYLGTTLLDVAKGAVETFMRVRQRDPNSRGDRYMLLTFEDAPHHVKSGWRESHTTFTAELRNLRARGLTRTGEALRRAFDLLNVNRMTSMVDTYGQGRCPYYLEPCVLVAITDAQRMTSPAGVVDELTIPAQSPLPGSELTKEPFRWDQRLFAICLRLPGHAPQEAATSGMLPADTSPIDAMCDVTGGRSYCVASQRQLNQCIESLVQKVQPGVVIHFLKIGPEPPPVDVSNGGAAKPADAAVAARSGSNSPVVDGNGARASPGDGGEITNFENCVDKENTDVNAAAATAVAAPKLENNIDEQRHLALPVPSAEKATSRPSTPVPQPLGGAAAWHSVKRLIYVQKSAQKGYSVGHWPIPEAFWPDLNSPALAPRLAHPVVRFACAPCEPMVVDHLPFDKYELEPSPLTQFILERKQPHVAWQVFVQNSAKHSDASHPFGYLKASSALACVNLFVMPYNYPVLLPLLDELFRVHKARPPPKWRLAFDNYLKTMPVYYAGPLRRALHRMPIPQSLVPDNLENCLSYSVLYYLKKVKSQAKLEFDRLVASVGQRPPPPDGVRVTARLQGSLPLRRRELHDALQLADERDDAGGGATVVLRPADGGAAAAAAHCYRNPFDIARADLPDQIARMRGNLLQGALTRPRLDDDDQRHSIPVGAMGNYQDYLKHMPAPLREVEAVPVRTHMFGNPFKVNKAMMVDEADLDLPGMPKDRKPRAESPAVFPGGPWRRKPGPLSPDVPYRRCPSPMPARVAADDSDFDMASTTTEEEGEDEVAPEASAVAVATEAAAEEELVMDFAGGGSANDVGRNEVFDDDDDDDTEEDDGALYADGTTNGEDAAVDGATTTTTPTTKNNVRAGAAAAAAENRRLRRVVFRELRRPGRNHDQLFDELNKMRGDLHTRLAFVRAVIDEAMRYKRRRVRELLEEYAQSMIQYERKLQRASSRARSSSGSSR
ncbi:PREDICTED: integrator complex subunit 6-B-like [Priapulus caudatus]|uniref:Integrator complex subunit 6-B-like n=1 Tax=Priapulus caudatus TaxID=37621 RepID=A0ABM1EF80_PRICU|nr:PREDICTED: integrator complex subunit 6-B-like [Priapulus caudatus]